ncbi:DHA2 family efflux MFS transporter permease subunit [Parvularcula dongshanensis]|uniref:DHA2 family multidrug resistance protein n=1 Tax=Parvularcula dongshanensis TaxID=1173995 RepID=A0A840I6N4_9PROT|nr:DHA2 family efflux MFS transporter permease subunit [Parvularcula dongshanensis]MBB4659660.1 DHA2 family multidrug resistance protein [Parvularcula dongshanensis]
MSEALPRSAAKPGVSPLLVAALVSFGTLVEALDSTALSVSLNTVAGNLGVGAEESDLILTTYLVANAAVMPISGWAATYFGRKRWFITCVILFTAASMLCAVAWNLQSLIFFRIIQGAAAAGNAASESSIIADSFTPKRRGLGFAIYSMAVVVGPAAGPILGGWVSDEYSWRWIFWSNVPVGIIAATAMILVIQDTPAVKRETKRVRDLGLKRVDWFGVLLAVGGLAAFEIFLDEGQPQDWFASTLIRVAFAVVILFLGVLPFWELNKKNPILDIRLFKNPNFAISFCLLFAIGLNLFGATTVLPLMLQQAFGYSATQAGIAVALGAVLVFLFIPVAGRLTGSVPTWTLILPGFLILTFSLYLTSKVNLEWSFTQIVGVRLVQALGLAFLFVPVQSHAYIGVPPDKSEQVGAFINLARNLGGSVGVALGTTLLARGRQSFQETLSVYASPYNDEYVRAAQQFGGPGAVYRELQAQVSILAYEQVFSSSRS